MTHTSTWKSAEREVAKRLGGERQPVSGRQRGATPDISHPWLSLEVKHKKSLPAWLKDAMDQAVKAVRGDQLPVVVLHEEGSRYDNSLVVMRLRDFVDWHGSIKEGE